MAVAFTASACQARADHAESFSAPENEIIQPTVLQPARLTPSTPTVVSTPSGCQQAEGVVETRWFESELFPKPITVNVYLPPCYDPNSSSEYPLLVLLHGQSYTHEQWLDMGLPQAVDQLINRGEAAPFVVAMPREEYYLQGFFESKYGNALIQGLLPWLSEEFHVCALADCRAIGGISRGAGWAVLLAFENLGTFSAVGAHSIPNAPFSDYRLYYLLGQSPDVQVPRLYVDSGRLDTYHTAALRFAELLEKYEVPFIWLEPEGTHTNEYWSAHLAEYLAWYARQIAPMP